MTMVEKLFKGYEPFQSLYELQIIKEGSVIRLAEGHIAPWEDGLFMVNGQGNLESMAQSEPPYITENVLSVEYSPNGWILEKR
jgi:hypothetical protein